jgi:hypothetical protein
VPRLFVAGVRTNKTGDGLWSITITVTNYGRTPAFVTHESAELWDGPLPSSPPYRPITVGPGVVIRKDEERRLIPRDQNDFSTFTDEAIKPNRFFWVFGIILYRDFLNNRHETRFCYRFVTLNDSGSAFMIVTEGPEAYTESY